MARTSSKRKVKAKTKTVRVKDDLKLTRKGLEAFEIDDEYDWIPPPYDKGPTPIVVGPNDPKDLAEVYNKVKSFEGSFLNAFKMIEGLETSDYNPEHLEYLGVPSKLDKDNMPGVVIFTGVIEEYSDMGRTLDALKAYKRMLASKFSPNAYTYSVLIETLAGDPDVRFLSLAKRYLVEMMVMGMKPNALTYTAVFKGFAQRGMVKEAKEFMEDLKARGFVADEKGVRECCAGRRGPMIRCLFNIMFGK